MAPHTTDDAPLWETLEHSAVGRLAALVSMPFVTAARSSRSMSTWHRLQTQWRGLSADAQMLAVGTLMTVAALIHVALAAMRAPVGFAWLIVPCTALMFGLTAMLLSTSRRASR